MTNDDALGADFYDEPSPQTDTTPPPGNDGTPAPSNDGNPSESADDSSIISELLAANGIADSSKIKFEEEDGTVNERNWNDLSKTEKLSILQQSSPHSEEPSDYNQDEIDLIMQIRDSQQSPAEYLESLKQEAAQANQTPSYEIDGIGDDELYVLDVIDKLGEENVTDEQLETLLKNAKSDPELYQKTIESLRTQYKQREDDLKVQNQKQQDAQQEQEYQAFSESILNEIQSLKQIAGQDIELTVDDMNELANFMLTRDEDGNSEFGKAMNDPKLFTQMAFWALKGNDIMNEISSQIKMAYEKGVEAGKKGQSQLAFNNKPTDASARQNASQLSADQLDVT